jgi:Fe(3+) dicitrate transport protein
MCLMSSMQPRASGYPGPGILPGEAQTFYLSIGAKF